MGHDFNAAAHVIKDLKRSYFILLKHRVVSMFHFITLLSGSGCLYAFFVPVGVAAAVLCVSSLLLLRTSEAGFAHCNQSQN